MVIAVASGKGGTGKTTVATNLALSLSRSEEVQYLDCDVEEPNAHLFLRPTLQEREPVQIPVPKVNQARCSRCGLCAQACPMNALAITGDRVLLLPQLCHGCGVCSLVCPEDAIEEVGRAIGVVEAGRAPGLGGEKIAFAHGYLEVGEAFTPPIVRAVRNRAAAPRVILDVAPGTSCPVVEALNGADLCLLVSEETPFGVHDLELITRVVKAMDLPAGVVINRAGQAHPEGLSQLRTFCRKESLPVLMEIPQSRPLAEGYARGEPLVQNAPEWIELFQDLDVRLRELVTST